LFPHSKLRYKKLLINFVKVIFQELWNCCWSSLIFARQILEILSKYKGFYFPDVKKDISMSKIWFLIFACRHWKLKVKRKNMLKWISIRKTKIRLKKLDHSMERMFFLKNLLGQLHLKFLEWTLSKKRYYCFWLEELPLQLMIDLKLEDKSILCWLVILELRNLNFSNKFHI